MSQAPEPDELLGVLVASLRAQGQEIAALRERVDLLEDTLVDSSKRSALDGADCFADAMEEFLRGFRRKINGWREDELVGARHGEDAISASSLDERAEAEAGDENSAVENESDDGLLSAESDLANLSTAGEGGEEAAAEGEGGEEFELTALEVREAIMAEGEEVMSPSFRTPAVVEGETIPQDDVAASEEAVPTPRDSSTDDSESVDGGHSSPSSDPDGSVEGEADVIDEAAAAGLPEGWIRALDPSTNMIFYHNRITGDCQWDPPTGDLIPPTGDIAAAAVADESNEAAEPAATLHNALLAQDPPEGSGDNSSSDSPAIGNLPAEEGIGAEGHRPSGGMEEASDPAISAKSTTLGREEGEEDAGPEVAEATSNGNANDGQELPMSPGSVANGNVENADALDGNVEDEALGEEIVVALPEGWIRAMDPSTNTVYYYNQITGDCRWDPPMNEMPVVASAAETPSAQDQSKEHAVEEQEASFVSTRAVADTSDAPQQQLDSGTKVASAVEEKDASAEEQPPKAEDGGVKDDGQWDGILDWADERRQVPVTPLGNEQTAKPYNEEPTAPSTAENVAPNDNTATDLDGLANEVNSIRSEPSGVLTEPSVHTEPSLSQDVPGEPDGSADLSFESLPAGWVDAFDLASNMKYYYNEATGESSWDRPLGMAMDESVDVNNCNDHLHVGGKPLEETETSDGINKQPVSEESTDGGNGANLGQIELSDNANNKQQLSEEETAGEPGTTDAEDEKPSSDDYAKDENGLPDVVDAAAASPALPPLAAGWIEAVDPSSGQTYYYSPGTGVSTWERPDGGAKHANSRKEEDVKKPDVSEDDKTTPSVEQEEDPTNGLLSHPAVDAKAGDSSEPSSALPDGWSEAVDPTSGETYYYNESSGASSWDRPKRDKFFAS